MKLIEVSHNKCVGCRLCEYVCSLSHDGDCSTSMSRIRIVRDEEFGNNLVSSCTHCEEAHCMESCVYDAISRDEKTGAVLIDAGTCNACQACLVVCPVDAVHFNQEKNVAFKCDLCDGDPECVKFCSRGALTLKEIDFASPERKSAMAETSRLLAQAKAQV